MTTCGQSRALLSNFGASYGCNYDLISTFMGKPVVDYAPGAPLEDTSSVAYRLGFSGLYDENELDFSGLLEGFLSDDKSRVLDTLIIGSWSNELYEGGGAQQVIDALVAAKDRLPALRHLFLAEALQEEAEISWIELCSVTPLLHAFDRLETFRVRGGNGLAFPGLDHPTLRRLAIESGGLPASTISEIEQAKLPALEYLELWLGIEAYGGITDVGDLQPLLTGSLFPHLAYLGLRNFELADDLAAVVAASPVVERIEVLDLSRGTLSDPGARALLDLPTDGALRCLDLHHHYVSDAMANKLRALPFEVDLSDRQQADVDGDVEYRYTAVSE